MEGERVHSPFVTMSQNIELERYVFCSLYDVLTSRKFDFTKTSPIKIATEIAIAMAYLHNKDKGSVIHRDLKSMNVLIDAHWHAKLADFGDSRLISGGGDGLLSIKGMLWMPVKLSEPNKLVEPFQEHPDGCHPKL